MLDLQRETKRRLAEVAERLGIHIVTAHRWRQVGVGGIRLPCMKLGGVFVTTDEAVDRWLAQINGAPPPPPPRAAAERAGRELDRKLAPTKRQRTARAGRS